MSSISDQPAGEEHNNLRRDAYKLHLKAIISLRASQTSQALVHLFVRSPDPAALMSVESQVV